MYEIDPSRTDLVREFEANPDGPYSPELALVVNRLRLMPIEERVVLVCTKRAREWALARIPARGKGPVEIIGDQRFEDHAEATREVFRRRWSTVVAQRKA